VLKPGYGRGLPAGNVAARRLSSAPAHPARPALRAGSGTNVIDRAFRALSGQGEAMKPFVALIYRGPDGIYRVSVPDFPAITVAGITFDHARVNAEWALFAHIRRLMANGDAIPEPSSLADVIADQGAQVMTLALIEVDEKATMAPTMIQHASESPLQRAPRIGSRLIGQMTS
jgi:predicted RNase H-like HicB family nuclease